MPNALFENYRNLIGGAGTHTLPNLASDNIKIHLIDTSGNPIYLDTQIDEADIVDASITATSGNITATFGSIGVGVFHHSDVTLLNVDGDTSDELVYWQDTGTDTTSPLICRFDTFSSGMPVTPNTGNIDIQPSGSGVFVI